MGRVHELVTFVAPETAAAARRAEFDREIATYWAQQTALGPTQVVLLAEPVEDGALSTLSDPRPRAIGTPPTVWASRDRAALMQLARRLGSPSGQVRRPVEAAFYQRLLSLPSVEVPSAAMLFAWLRDCCEDAGRGIAAWLGATQNLPERHLVLELPPSGGDRQHVVLTLRDRALTKRASPKYGKRARRAHRVELAVDRADLVRSQLQVLSRESVHSRNAQTAATLAAKRVVLVGGGALGGQVAAQLARAGVGQLTVVDPDTLNAENLSRHVLGLDDLGRPKAYALRDRLMKDVPSVEVTPIYGFVENEDAVSRRALDAADVVIVTTADWGSELSLLHRKRDGAPWALIQAWSEPHAVAGHALVIPAGDAHDATPLFDAQGRFRHEATTGWLNDGFVEQPQCGGRFIPAGPIGLAAIASMVSQAATDVLDGKISERAWRRYRAGRALVAQAGGQPTATAPEGLAEVEHRSWPGGAVE